MKNILITLVSLAFLVCGCQAIADECAAGEPSCVAICNGTIMPIADLASCEQNCCDGMTNLTATCSYITRSQTNTGDKLSGCCATDNSGCITEM